MTFVYREVLALRALGLEVATFSTWRPSESELSQEAKPLVASTTYLLPIKVGELLRLHLRWLAKHPPRYLATLLFCLAHSTEGANKNWRTRLHNLRRTLLHFAQAVVLAERCTQQGIDHLHVHFALNATTLAMIVARFTHITYSFTAHANDIFVNPILLPQKIQAARFIVAISDYNARFLEQVVPGAATRAKIATVRCGIDVQHFAPTKFAQERTQQQEKPLILAIGRLVEKKGFPNLVEACALLNRQGHRFECVIVGDGPQRDLLSAMIAKQGIDHVVHLAGTVFQEGIMAYLARAAIITLPCVVAADNDMDGIPNSLMEGMAMGVPAVSTTLSGIPELVEEGVNGLLVPPNDPVALAHALAELLEDAPLRARLGRAARAKVMADYDLMRNSAALLAIFQARLGDPASAALSSPLPPAVAPGHDPIQEDSHEAIHAY
jgi:glycosyltransferase involved in cell wall biosynthesis